jgi:hypothetical protein
MKSAPKFTQTVDEGRALLQATSQESRATTGGGAAKSAKLPRSRRVIPRLLPRPRTNYSQAIEGEIISLKTTPR